jgi:hypothetical protein
VVNIRPRPLYHGEADPLPITHVDTRVSGPPWTRRENLSSTGGSNPGRSSSPKPAIPTTLRRQHSQRKQTVLEKLTVLSWSRISPNLVSPNFQCRVIVTSSCLGQGLINPVDILTVLAPYPHGTGPISSRYRPHILTVLAPYPHGTGPISSRYWPHILTVLAPYLTVLAPYPHGTGPILIFDRKRN